MTSETKSGLLAFWQGVRTWAFKYLGGLFMEEKSDGEKVISIGRCMLIAILAWMFSFWSTWMAIMTITPEMLAQAVIAQLPEGSQPNGVDILAAARLVVDALPKAAPPMMQMAFLTACGYVFGTKVQGVVATRLNGGR